MATVRNLEWLNSNSERNYPLAEMATRLDTTNSFILPNFILADAIFSVENPAVAFYLKDIYFLDKNVILNIYDQNDVLVGSVNIDIGTHTTYKAYAVIGSGIYQYLQGKLIVGDLTELKVLGHYEFTIAASQFEHRCLLPALRGLAALQINNTQLVTGVVRLVAGYNIRFRYEAATNSIFIDAIAGEGLGPVCTCGADVAPPVALETINGIGGPNVDIRGVGCIQVMSSGQVITIANTCEQPCCECDDVNALQAILDAQNALLANLNTRVYALEN